MKLRKITFWATFALLAFGISTACWACPTCKEGFAEGSNHANLVRGYFWSILFMMSMPFLILGGLSTYFYLQIVKARIATPAPSPAATCVE